MNALWLIVLVGASSLLLIWFWRASMRPTPIPLRSADELLTGFRTLLQNGAKGARLRFQAKNDPSLKLDFIKYIHAQNDVGFRAILGRTPQLLSAFDLVASELDRQRISYQRSTGKGGTDELSVDLGRDFVLAERIARQAFEQALGLSLARDINGFYDLVLISHHPRLTGLDSPKAF